MADPTKTQLTYRLHVPHELASALFLERVTGAGLDEIKALSWPTAERSLEALGPPTLRTAARECESALYDMDGVLLEVSLMASHLNVVAAGIDRGAVDAVIERVERLFPPPDPSSAHEIPVTFWMYTPQGPRPSWRSIAVPAWDDIEGNYPGRTRRQLAELMHDFQPARGGQLVLWHGEAGTGKTFALRALAWEWRTWCQIHYIVDPDSFFGEHADYLMSVLLESPFPMMVGATGYGPLAGPSAAMVRGNDFLPEDGRRIWRLLVLEDTGELLAADARERTGQGLSRFLNVVDGLIGQGLQVIVLVTTNEEIRKLHPAVARPGRCAANVRFDPLRPEEAAKWLLDRGISAEVSEARTLASLYAEAEGRDPSETLLVGFGN
jgi:hypothetical protein